jgi:hypothetical protein
MGGGKKGHAHGGAGGGTASHGSGGAGNAIGLAQTALASGVLGKKGVMASAVLGGHGGGHKAGGGGGTSGGKASTELEGRCRHRSLGLSV